MLASDILTDVRFALSDSAKDRWSDARLLALLNDALKDVALKSKLFNRRTYVKLLDEVVHYDISEFALKIRRVEYNRKKLPFKSHEEMDNYGRNSNNSDYDTLGNGSRVETGFNYLADGGADWKEHVGTEVSAIIYDKQDFGNFMTYPIVENTNYDNVEVTSNFGLIADINYSDLEIVPTDDFGTLNPPNILDYVYVYYIAKHAELTAVGDTIDMHVFHKDMLVNYVTARAYKDNIDTQSREMSAEYMELYGDRLDTLNEENSSNYVESTTTTVYRSME